MECLELLGKLRRQIAGSAERESFNQSMQTPAGGELEKKDALI